MAQTHFLVAVRTLSVTVLALTQLVGCLGSEESKSSDEITRDVAVSGSVGDGPIVGATMRVLQNNGTELAQFQSDSNASYLVTVNTQDQNFPLIVEATGGTDIVTNLSPDFVLEGAVFTPGDRRVANVNPFSTIAIAAARDLPGGLNAANLQIAQATVASVFNGGLNSLVTSGPMVTHIDEHNIAEVVKASETLAETVRRTRDLLNAFGYSTNGDQVVRVIGSDINDDVIDGRGGSNVNARTSAVMIIVIAQVFLESMANELWVNGGDATAAMDTAINQVSARTPTVSLNELPVTAEMINAVRVGLAAAFALAGDTRISGLHAAVSGLQHGMEPSLVRTFLPADYRSVLQNALTAVAGGTDATVDMINDVARGGGDIGTGNRAPSIQGTPAGAVMVGVNYSFTPSAADPDGDALSFSITNPPTWASFNSGTGELSGTPTVNDVGTYSNIVITVSDGALNAGLAPFSINVSQNNSAPQISGTPAGSVIVGGNYSFTPSASDPDGDTLTFSVSNRPAWASFNSSTGSLSGTPGAADVATYSGIVVSVSDGMASASIGPFAITVVPGNSAPQISGTPPAAINAGTSYSFTPNASDPDGDALTFTVTSLPSWANFNASNGGISGIPSVGDVGVHSNIRITVTDGAASATLGPFTITVNAVSNGSVTLNWTPPTQNDDGSALVDLAGYTIYWGTTPGIYPNSVTINNASISTYVVDNLSSGTYEFVATSFNTSGIESVFSNPVTKVVP